MNETHPEMRQRIALRGITRFDLAVIFPIVAVSFFLVFFHGIGLESQAASTARVVLYHEGKTVGQYALDQEQMIDVLQGRMRLEIKDNALRIARSDCPRQFCVHQGWIRHAGEMIACVPFKTMIEIQGGGQPMVDAQVF